MPPMVLRRPAGGRSGRDSAGPGCWPRSMKGRVSSPPGVEAALSMAKTAQGSRASQAVGKGPQCGA